MRVFDEDHAVYRAGLRTERFCFLAAIMTLTAGIWLTGCSSEHGEGRERVQIGPEQFVLELAVDSRAREQGLMHREHIDPGTGMLFVFPDSEVKVQSFWMGNCKTDMDIIFLDLKGFITAVHEMKVQEPQRPGESDADYRRRMPSYTSGTRARFAIELPPGSIKRLGLKPEQRIELDVERLKALAR